MGKERKQIMAKTKKNTKKTTTKKVSNKKKMVKKTNVREVTKAKMVTKKQDDLKFSCCGETSCKVGKVEVFVCPNCQSTNVGYSFKLRNLFGVIPKMLCKECGFGASIFPKWVIDKDKITDKKSKPVGLNKKQAKEIKRANSKDSIGQEYCPNCEDDHLFVKMKDGSVNKFVCENCEFEVKKK